MAWAASPTIATSRRVRAIVARAGKHDDRFSEYVLGIVESPAFTERSAPARKSAESDKSVLKADAGSDGPIHAFIATKPLQVAEDHGDAQPDRSIAVC